MPIIALILFAMLVTGCAYAFALLMGLALNHWSIYLAVLYANEVLSGAFYWFIQYPH